MLKTFLGILFLSATAYAQSLGVGLKLGVPATEAFKVIQAQSIADQQNLVWGPYLDLGLPGGNSIEIDALRRKYSFGTAGSASSWEFPVVLKHRIGQGMIRPYFEGGAAFSRLSDINLNTLKHRQNYGLVVGGGVEIKFLFLKLSPEVRYTAWAVSNFDGSVQSKKNQLAVLMGFGF
ncbi:MAG: hypothetical protein ABIR70_02025 [Bryobacteraceae bacterium]